MNVCPASRPLIPARMLMELEQKTASRHMYVWYRMPSSRNSLP